MAATTPVDVKRRALQTLALLALYAGAMHAPIPGLDATQASRLGFELHPVTFGVQPALSAFLTVELVAALVPRWRKLRISGEPGRRKLDRAAYVYALVLAGFQAFGVAMMLEAMHYGEGAGDLLTFGSATIVALVLLAGAAFTLLVAVLVRRAGLLNGFVILTLATTGTAAVQRAPSSESSALLLPALTFLVLPLAATWLCLGASSHARDSLTLPAPASSLQPVAWAPAVLAAPIALAGVTAVPPSWSEFAQDAQNSAGWLVVLTCLLGAALASLLNRAGDWPPLLQRLGFARAPAVRTTRAAWREALRDTLLFLVVVSACELGLRLTVGLENLATTACLTMAAALDLAASIEAHRQTGRSVSVWRDPRAHLLPLVRRHLERAGIRAAAHGWAQGVLLRFFGPYALPELRVLEGDAPRARAVIEEFTTGSAPVTLDDVPPANAHREPLPAASRTLRLAALAVAACAAVAAFR